MMLFDGFFCDIASFYQPGDIENVAATAADTGASAPSCQLIVI